MAVEGKLGESRNWQKVYILWLDRTMILRIMRSYKYSIKVLLETIKTGSFALSAEIIYTEINGSVH